MNEPATQQARCGERVGPDERERLGPAALRVEGLAKAYRGGAIPVFSGLSLSVPQGQRLAIIGANGSGKSTLLRCCLRLIEPDQGRVFMTGQELTGLGRRELRRVRARVGMVFQRHQLVPELSVLSNVLHGALGRRSGPRCWLQSLAPQAEREEAMRCLDLVGLAELALRPLRECSGGQSQRVAIARALMQRPELLVADEPAASLDPQAGREVMAIFSQLAQRRRLTLIFVSHHLEHALRFSDRIVGLREGVLALDRPASDCHSEGLEGIYG